MESEGPDREENDDDEASVAETEARGEKERPLK